MASTSQISSAGTNMCENITSLPGAGNISADQITALKDWISNNDPVDKKTGERGSKKGRSEAYAFGQLFVDLRKDGHNDDVMYDIVAADTGLSDSEDECYSDISSSSDDESDLSHDSLCEEQSEEDEFLQTDYSNNNLSTSDEENNKNYYFPLEADLLNIFKDELSESDLAQIQPMLAYISDSEYTPRQLILKCQEYKLTPVQLNKLLSILNTYRN